MNKIYRRHFPWTRIRTTLKDKVVKSEFPLNKKRFEYLEIQI